MSNTTISTQQRQRTLRGYMHLSIEVPVEAYPDIVAKIPDMKLYAEKALIEALKHEQEETIEQKRKNLMKRMENFKPFKGTNPKSSEEIVREMREEREKQLESKIFEKSIPISYLYGDARSINHLIEEPTGIDPNREELLKRLENTKRSKGLRPAVEVLQEIRNS